MTMKLAYRPWQPKEGMAGTYRHLVRSWGDPNGPRHKWPADVLARVCERGEPREFRYDRECLKSYAIYARILR